MANFWVQQERWAVRDTECITFGDLVKPFGRKYKGMWRVFGISENGEIILILIIYSQYILHKYKLFKY